MDKKFQLSQTTRLVRILTLGPKTAAELRAYGFEACYLNRMLTRLVSYGAIKAEKIPDSHPRFNNRVYSLTDETIKAYAEWAEM